ncbi:MAG: SURF1 family protein [Actinomycetes bacterium]
MERRRVLGLLRQPSWIGLTLLVIMLGITFTELGLWQLRRHDERAAANSLLVTNLAAAPVAVTDLLPADQPLPGEDEWRLVTASGVYDPEQEVLVRNRSYEGELGYEVVTPLVPSTGPAVLVLRGWVPNGSSAAAVPAVPPAPAGEVVVTARLRPTPTGGTDATGLPAGQVRQLAVPVIAGSLPYEVLEGGYAQLVVGAPGSDAGLAGPRALTAPEPNAGPHRPYAVQWFLFGVIAIGGWGVLLRAGLREDPGARPHAVREPPPVAVGPR